MPTESIFSHDHLSTLEDSIVELMYIILSPVYTA